jgi:hypothetical protein
VLKLLAAGGWGPHLLLGDRGEFVAAKRQPWSVIGMCEGAGLRGRLSCQMTQRKKSNGGFPSLEIRLFVFLIKLWLLRFY